MFPGHSVLVLPNVNLKMKNPVYDLMASPCLSLSPTLTWKQVQFSGR